MITRGAVFDVQGVRGEADAVRRGTASSYSPRCLLFRATGPRGPSEPRLPTTPGAWRAVLGEPSPVGSRGRDASVRLAPRRPVLSGDFVVACQSVGR